MIGLNPTFLINKSLRINKPGENLHDFIFSSIKIWIKKIDYAGIMADWFESYIFNKKHFVKIIQCVECKAPQGRLLGSLLFVIHVNYIFTLTLKAMFHNLRRNFGTGKCCLLVED